MSIRVVFMGTPEFAVPILEALLQDSDIEVVGVMTQPDRPAGRGYQLTPPPVKTVAEQAGLVVKQPIRLRKEPDMIDWLRGLQPDYLVTAAFGQILPQEVLDIPNYGTVNVHASLLPKYRGPNPVQWAILNGDELTGVTTMLTALEVDSGPMLLTAGTQIDPDEDAVTLTQRLAQLGSIIIVPSLKEYAAGRIRGEEQKHDQATHAPKLTKADANIDWTQPAHKIHNRIRGQQPWPGAVTAIDNQQLKLIRSRSPKTWKQSKTFMKRGQPGEILAIIHDGIVVQTGAGPLLVETVQPPGKPKMPARDWANGSLKNLSQRRFNNVENTVELT